MSDLGESPVEEPKSEVKDQSSAEGSPMSSSKYQGASEKGSMVSSSGKQSSCSHSGPHSKLCSVFGEGKLFKTKSEDASKLDGKKIEFSFSTSEFSAQTAIHDLSKLHPDRSKTASKCYSSSGNAISINASSQAKPKSKQNLDDKSTAIKPKSIPSFSKSKSSKGKEKTACLSSTSTSKAAVSKDHNSTSTSTASSSARKKTKSDDGTKSKSSKKKSCVDLSSQQQSSCQESSVVEANAALVANVTSSSKSGKVKPKHTSDRTSAIIGSSVNRSNKSSASSALTSALGNGQSSVHTSSSSTKSSSSKSRKSKK